jgi:PAS domain S-box-containing protein
MEENHIIALQTPPEKNYAVSLRKIEELLDRKSNGLTIGQIAKQIGTNRNSVAKYLEILLITGKVELRTVGPAKLYLPAKRIPLTSILEFTPSLIAVLDSQLRLAQANGPLLTFAGKRAEDVLGMDVRHVELPPLTSEYMLAHVGEALNGSPFKASITATKEGKQHQFEARLTPAVIEGGQRTLICIFEDVTEQRQTAQSAHLLTAIFASSSDAIVSMSLDGTITSWNAAAKRIYGYTPGEIIGKSLKTLYPPEGENETTLLLERAHDEMRMFPFETVRVRKDGVRISVSATLSPVWNAEGKMIGISSVSRDITERKKTEEALRKSDERFRAIVDTSPNGIALVEPDLTFTFVNTKISSGRVRSRSLRRRSGRRRRRTCTGCSRASRRTSGCSIRS